MSGPRPPKRQRIYRACDQCRRRKSKCDGEQPVCSICSQANRACTYETGGGRRGLPSGYVRSLEITLGLIFQHAPNSQNTVQSVLRDSRGQGNFLTSKLAKRSVSVWRKSKAYRDLSQLISPGSEDEVLDDSEWEPVELAESWDNDETMADLDSAPSNPEPHKPGIIQKLPNDASRSHIFMNVQLPDRTSDLVDFYFTYTHCWFPILERRSVLRAMHLGNDNSKGNDQGDLSSKMVLWSLVAYTSAMRGDAQPATPNLFTLQLAIEQQALMQWEALDLGYIQAMLILILMHVAMGNINQAWPLVAKASRMLVTLPLSARKTRFNHVFNGCVLLDNMLSTLLDRAPCLSREEQSMYGPIEEDDLEEWDVWSPSRPGMDEERHRMPAAPLRALSIFNHIQQLMQQLSRVLYQPLDPSRIESLLNDLRTKQNIISRSHPYDRQNYATPSLLNLYLVSGFTTLAFCGRFEPVSSATEDSCAHTIHHILDILDHYREMTGTTGSSPLTLCFAMQCQRSLAIGNLSDTQSLQNRISSFLHPLKPIGLPEWKNKISRPALPIPSLEREHQPPVDLEIPLSIPALTGFSNSTPPPFIPQQSEPSSVMNLPTIPSSNEFPSLQSLGGTGDAEMYDALFEEMVTSFPASRQEPAFAHNLGFYDGDLDTDFLAQLQHPPMS
ncbi:hypothetical protein N7481_011750 [Penicillium waksmanii]|uniref:uncharacterized protein n=1 Tax=Penicillium waksmanii TaxID=69791 RepID=UPI002546B543|nr:uncharacterized protein N7481_011750 [Penicillium waksmanii]KAJ5974540.1 hypothetical protein N7481_011750 [Penicillium waksmanii]